MTLNDKETAEIVRILKKMYTNNRNSIVSNTFPSWIKDDKQREEYIAYTDKLKSDYEAIERGEEFELHLPLNCNGEEAMYTDFALIIISAIYGVDGNHTKK